MPIKRMKFTIVCLMEGFFTAEQAEKGTKGAKVLCRHSGAGQNLLFFKPQRKQRRAQRTQSRGERIPLTLA